MSWNGDGSRKNVSGQVCLPGNIYTTVKSTTVTAELQLKTITEQDHTRLKTI